MTLVLCLVLVPFLAGWFCFACGLSGRAASWWLTVTAAVCAGSVALACLPAPMTLGELPVSRHGINLGMMAVEALMGLYILYVGVRAQALSDRGADAGARRR